MIAFDQIAPTYDSTPNPLLALEERILTPFLPNMSGLTVADIGAGTGRWLRRVSAARTIAIDRSPAMLARAPQPRILADAGSLPLRDASIDIVFCTFTLGYVPSCFAELVRITGNKLIVTDVHPDAVTRGWSRMAPHVPYALSDLTHPNLTRTHLFEPCIDEPERPLFASKPHLYEPAREYPAIFIAIWNKQ
ncbi:MAG: class I SAM-dependent methyltransferase [Bryobacteraceae bacterium]